MSDMTTVREDIKTQSAKSLSEMAKTILRTSVENHLNYLNLFVWSDTKEGKKYWSDINKTLRKLQEQIKRF